MKRMDGALNKKVEIIWQGFYVISLSCITYNKNPQIWDKDLIE